MDVAGGRREADDWDRRGDPPAARRLRERREVALGSDDPTRLSTPDQDPEVVASSFGEFFRRAVETSGR